MALPTLLNPPTPPSEPHSPLSLVAAAASSAPGTAAVPSVQTDDEMASPSSSSGDSEMDDLLTYPSSTPGAFAGPTGSSSAVAASSSGGGAGAGRGAKRDGRLRAGKKDNKDAGRRSRKGTGGGGTGLSGSYGDDGLQLERSRLGGGKDDKLIGEKEYDTLRDEIGDVLNLDNLRSLALNYHASTAATAGAARASPSLPEPGAAQSPSG